MNSSSYKELENQTKPNLNQTKSNDCVPQKLVSEFSFSWRKLVGKNMCMQTQVDVLQLSAPSSPVSHVIAKEQHHSPSKAFSHLHTQWQKSTTVALFCSCTNDLLQPLLLVQAFSLSGQVTAPRSPETGSPAPQLSRRDDSYQHTRWRTVQPTCCPSAVLCSAACLPTLSLALLQSRWWEVTWNSYLSVSETTSSPPGTGPFPGSTPWKRWSHNSDSIGDKERLRL